MMHCMFIPAPFYFYNHLRNGKYCCIIFQFVSGNTFAYLERKIVASFENDGSRIDPLPSYQSTFRLNDQSICLQVKLLYLRELFDATLQTSKFSTSLYMRIRSSFSLPIILLLVYTNCRSDNKTNVIGINNADSLAPVETKKPNSDYKPAFKGQTRIAAVTQLQNIKLKKSQTN